jgi:hypothetical protein
VISSKNVSLNAVVFMAVVLVLPAYGQNVSSVGQGWTSSWGFKSSSDASIALSRAQVIRSVEKTPSPTSVTTYNTTYTNDNRSNYVDVVTEGQVTTDFQLGDRIGQNTNAVGSMNTGTTNIDIQGSSNVISATNSADNTGCVNGSALDAMINDPAFIQAMGLAGALNNDVGDVSVSVGAIASPEPTCVQ